MRFAFIFLLLLVLTSLPSVFAQQNSSKQLAIVAADCIRTGCSGQICSDRVLVSTCEYKESYACYAQAVCERNSQGICGFRQTPELLACLSGEDRSTTPTPTIIIDAEPLQCTGATCTVINRNESAQLQCQMNPVASSQVNTRTIEYEGYCTRKKQTSQVDSSMTIDSISRSTDQIIQLTPVLPSSPRFQTLPALPGMYSCYFRYCLTDEKGQKQCLPWGTGGNVTRPTPLITPQTTCTPRPACLDSDKPCRIAETENLCPPGPIPTSYRCPNTPWINCMPTIGEQMKTELCTASYINWAEKNCPTFEGVAY